MHPHRAGSIIAEYDVKYAMEEMVEKTDEIVEHIQDTVLPRLANETINGKSVDEEYLDNEVKNQLGNQSEFCSLLQYFEQNLAIFFSTEYLQMRDT